MAKKTKATVIEALAKPDRFLMVTYIGSDREFSVPGLGVVPRKVAETLTLFEDTSMPVQRKGEQALVPQEDGLFPGFSQTWRAEN